MEWQWCRSPGGGARRRQQVLAGEGVVCTSGWGKWAAVTGRAQDPGPEAMEFRGYVEPLKRFKEEM